MYLSVYPIVALSYNVLWYTVEVQGKSYRGNWFNFVCKEEQFPMNVCTAVVINKQKGKLYLPQE